MRFTGIGAVAASKRERLQGTIRVTFTRDRRQTCDLFARWGVYLPA